MNGASPEPDSEQMEGNESSDTLPILEQIRQAQVVFQQLGLAYVSAMTKYRPQILQIGEAVTSISLVAGEAITKSKIVVDALYKELVPILGKAYKAYQLRLETYPNLPGITVRLANLGWFISLDVAFHDLDSLAVSPESLSDTELENIAAQIYRDSINELAKVLIGIYPERAVIISQAVSAHERGDYALSVPVFFAQADGICADKAKKYIFLGSENGPRHISSLADEKIARIESLQSEEGVTLSTCIALAMWNPLKEHKPIGYNEGRRAKEGYQGLNRHQVLHGESLDYPTEINSLKAFSLLSHVSALLRDIGKE